MKTKGWFIVWVLPVIASFTAAGQCSSMKTISYDTVVSGSGNNDYSFSFPKFDPTLGTLTSVVINTQVTLKYTFQLENKELISINNYKVRAVREDDISSDALFNPITTTHQQTYGPYLLGPADGTMGAGIDFISQGPLYVMNHTIVTDTVYNTGDFMGIGNVDFDYASTTYSIVFGSVNYAFNGTAQDSTDFSITYTYCQNQFLAADISSFTAIKENDAAINIRWIAQNENPNRHYEVQKSTDGKNFTGLAQFLANAGANQVGSYSYQYVVQAADRKLMFRLKEIENDATIKYSPVRVVDVGKNTDDKPRLYPNPSSGPATLVFNNVKRGDWQVQVCNINGQVVQQYSCNNALLLQLNNNKQLSKGLYMVKAINKKTEEQFVNRLIIQ